MLQPQLKPYGETLDVYDAVRVAKLELQPGERKDHTTAGYIARGEGIC